MVYAQGNGKDDAANILNTIKNCNNSGHVVTPQEQGSTVRTALDLTFLQYSDLGIYLPIINEVANTITNTDIQGSIQLKNNTDYRQPIPQASLTR